MQLHYTAAIFLFVLGCSTMKDRMGINNSSIPSLHADAYAGNIPQLEQKLAQGANISERNCDGRTPLCVSVIGNQFPTFRWLCNHGASIKNQLILHEAIHTDAGAHTSISLAALTNDPNQMEGTWSSWIISHYPKLLQEVDAQKQTALHVAIARENEDIVEELLACYPMININAKDKNGQTALHLAIARENKDIVGQLLACENININAYNKQGQTALQLAILYRLSQVWLKSY